MTALRVAASAPAAGSGAVAPVVASLPVSLRWVEAGNEVTPDLVAIDGGTGWPGRVRDAVRRGARGLLLVQPVAVAPDDVPRAAVPVVVDHRFAGNPAVPPATGDFEEWPAEALVEVSSLLADRAGAQQLLLDQLAVLRLLGLPPVSLERLTWSRAGYHLRGATSVGSPLLLSAHVTTGSPPQLRVRGLAPDLAVELTVPDPGTARPAVLVRTTSDGATTRPTVWETSHRASWRRLHAAVVEGVPTDDLAGLRADLTLAGGVLPDP